MANLNFIENECYNIGISRQGAEFQSLYYKPAGYNYLWDADPAYWGKHAPLLFPIVGALDNDTYTYGGVQYRLPRHGFARDMEFDIVEQSGQAITMELQDSAETLAVYPFNFSLQVRYELLNDMLACSYTVLNRGDDEMYFSIGAHPAFNVPLNGTDAFTDGKIVFSDDEVLHVWPLAGNVLAGTQREVMLHDKTLPLSHELFAKDALVMKDMRSSKVTMYTDKHGHGVEMDFKGFNFFGIWSAKDAPFVCLEPWHGVADTAGGSGRLEDKEGIIKLGAGESFETTWRLRCF